MRISLSLAVLLLAGPVLLVGQGCKKSGDAETVRLNGAGATFPYPLYSKWMHAYRQANPSVEINYQSIGSGGGIRQILEKTVDFGASDAPMSDADLAKASGPIHHIPTALGAVVIIYNLDAVATGLKLDARTLAAIFLGQITTWNDPAITASNPGVTLPGTPITVVQRSDGSGTTAVFTDYLAKVSPDWKTRVGQGTSVKWPVGLGGKGNEGVTGQVKNTPGSIAYVELAYAHQNRLPVASLKSAAGDFVEPSVASLTAAAAAVPVPADFRVSITNASGPGAYPISAFTYILVYEDTADAARGKALVKFLRWAVTDGQALAGALDYGALPAELVPRVQATLKTLKAAGQPVL